MSDSETPDGNIMELKPKAFITEVKFKKYQKSSNSSGENLRLTDVRIDHGHLLNVIDAIGQKVGKMVEKQREEYMTAYEQHMFDVHKQIYLLRERLEVITNDKTREERINVLNLQQDYFEKKALNWDAKNAILEAKLEIRTKAWEAEEIEHKWLLKRIHQENRKLESYNIMAQDMASSSIDSVESSSSFLRGEHSHVELGEGDSSSSEMSSYYAIEWKPRHTEVRTRRWTDGYKAITNTYANINNTIKRNETILNQTKSKMMNLNRSQTASSLLNSSQSLSQLPSLYHVHTSGSLVSRSSISSDGKKKINRSDNNNNNNCNHTINNNNNNTPKRAMSSSASLSTLHHHHHHNQFQPTPSNTNNHNDDDDDDSSNIRSEQSTINQQQTAFISSTLNKEREKEALKEIITFRAKKEEMSEFLEQCAYSVNRQVTATGQTKGGWRKFAKLHQSDMILNSTDLITQCEELVTCIKNQQVLEQQQGVEEEGGWGNQPNNDNLYSSPSASSLLSATAPANSTTKNNNNTNTAPANSNNSDVANSTTDTIIKMSLAAYAHQLALLPEVYSIVESLMHDYSNSDS